MNLPHMEDHSSGRRAWLNQGEDGAAAAGLQRGRSAPGRTSSGRLFCAAAAAPSKMHSFGGI